MSTGDDTGNQQRADLIVTNGRISTQDGRRNDRQANLNENCSSLQLRG